MCLLSRNSGKLNLQESYGPLEACRGGFLQCDNGFSEGKFCVLFVFVLFCVHAHSLRKEDFLSKKSYQVFSTEM